MQINNQHTVVSISGLGEGQCVGIGRPQQLLICVRNPVICTLTEKEGGASSTILEAASSSLYLYGRNTV